MGPGARTQEFRGFHRRRGRWAKEEKTWRGRPGASLAKHPDVRPGGQAESGPRSAWTPANPTNKKASHAGLPHPKNLPPNPPTPRGRVHGRDPPPGIPALDRDDRSTLVPPPGLQFL